MSEAKLDKNGYLRKGALFAEGNKGGPGVPKGITNQILRRRGVALDCITDKDMQAVTKELLRLCTEANKESDRIKAIAELTKLLGFYLPSILAAVEVDPESGMLRVVMATEGSGGGNE